MSDLFLGVHAVVVHAVRMLLLVKVAAGHQPVLNDALHVVGQGAVDVIAVMELGQHLCSGREETTFQTMTWNWESTSLAWKWNSTSAAISNADAPQQWEGGHISNQDLLNQLGGIHNIDDIAHLQEREIFFPEPTPT